MRSEFPTKTFPNHFSIVTVSFFNAILLSSTSSYVSMLLNVNFVSLVPRPFPAFQLMLHAEKAGKGLGTRLNFVCCIVQI